MGKAKILGADHRRYQEVAERRRYRRDQEEEDHDDAMHGEHLIVDVRFEQVAGGGGQFEPDHGCEDPAEEEEEGDGDEIEDGDPLVVRGEQPTLQTVPIS